MDSRYAGDEQHARCRSPADQPRPDRRVVCADARFFIGMEHHRAVTSRRDNFTALAEFALHGDVVILPVGRASSSSLPRRRRCSAGQEFAVCQLHRQGGHGHFRHVPRFVQHLPSPSADLILLGARHDHARRCPRERSTDLSRAAPPDHARRPGFINPEASQRRVGMAKWAEDAFACMAIDRAVARAGATLRRILLRPNASKGIWVHNIKDRGEYRRCHTIGDSCYGMDHPRTSSSAWPGQSALTTSVRGHQGGAVVELSAGSIPGRNGAVACCPAACGACGGSGCDQRPGGRASCCGCRREVTNVVCGLAAAVCAAKESNSDCKIGPLTGHSETVPPGKRPREKGRTRSGQGGGGRRGARFRRRCQ